MSGCNCQSPSPCSTCKTGSNSNACCTGFSITEIPNTKGLCYNWTINGMTQRFCLPGETLTTLRSDRTNRRLDYLREDGEHDYIPYTDILNGGRLGDLQDVDDQGTGNCSILVKAAAANCVDCGGSAADRWYGWEALKNKVTVLQYVMGFNEEGCPVVLDKPADTSKTWIQGWKGGIGDMYYQPTDIGEIPVTDGKAQNVVVINPSTGDLEYGSLAIESDIYTNCVMGTVRNSDPSGPGYFIPLGGTEDIFVWTNNTNYDMLMDFTYCVNYGASDGSGAGNAIVEVTPHLDGEAADEMNDATHHQNNYPAHSAQSLISQNGANFFKVPKGRSVYLYADSTLTSGAGQVRVHAIRYKGIPGRVVNA